jgi:hypothetical protein
MNPFSQESSIAFRPSLAARIGYKIYLSLSDQRGMAEDAIDAPIPWVFRILRGLGLPTKSLNPILLSKQIEVAETLPCHL